ncbi:hypothetical protein CcCBS67573_g04129 [Chytriomyces confervae]|uniref:Eukaryotic translation initiation factor 2D n=1 Tax=Chytriomyces confervae TaxID=246404 RepID=A0A507FEF3_9FUNG|nr:hypothetical protein CcCBS67573_g04129 [Chytriomyces confervae]
MGHQQQQLEQEMMQIEMDALLQTLSGPPGTSASNDYSEWPDENAAVWIPAQAPTDEQGDASIHEELDALLNQLNHSESAQAINAADFHNQNDPNALNIFNEYSLFNEPSPMENAAFFNLPHQPHILNMFNSPLMPMPMPFMFMQSAPGSLAMSSDHSTAETLVQNTSAATTSTNTSTRRVNGRRKKRISVFSTEPPGSNATTCTCIAACTCTVTPASNTTNPSVVFSQAAIKASTRRRTVEEPLECIECHDPIGVLELRGTPASFESGYAPWIKCKTCCESFLSNQTTGATSSSSASLTRKRRSAPAPESPADRILCCLVCKRPTAQGCVKSRILPSSPLHKPSEPISDPTDPSFPTLATETNAPQYEWRTPEFSVTLICSSCHARYLFCSECGGGGKTRTGKYRPRALFPLNRRTCSLPHIRIGTTPVSHRVLEAPLLSASGSLEIVEGVRDVFFDCLVSLYAVPGVLEAGVDGDGVGFLGSAEANRGDGFEDRPDVKLMEAGSSSDHSDMRAIAATPESGGTLSRIYKQVEELWASTVLDAITSENPKGLGGGKIHVTVAWIEKRNRNKGLVSRKKKVKDEEEVQDEGVPWLVRLAMEGTIAPLKSVGGDVGFVSGKAVAGGRSTSESRGNVATNSFPGALADEGDASIEKTYVSFAVSEWDRARGALFILQMAPRSVYLPTKESYGDLLQRNIERVQADSRRDNAPPLQHVWCWTREESHSRLKTIPERLGFVPLEQYIRENPGIDRATFSRDAYPPLMEAGVSVHVTSVKKFMKMVATYSTKLRGSDQRKLRDEVEAMLEASNSGSEDLRDGGSVSVLFAEALTRMSVDVGGPHRIAAYGRGDNVVFVRVDPAVDSATNSISSDGVLLPTVYALSIEPKLLPHIVTHAGVVRRLMQGADLMLPGVLKPVETRIRKGDPVAIVSNGAPVAVAFAAMDATEMLANGMRGKGFVIVHVVGDALFAMGDGVIATSNLEAQLDSEEDDDDDSEFVVVEREDVDPAITRADSDPVVLEMETLSLYDAESIVKVANAPSVQQSPQEMDRMLELALLTSIKISLPQDSKAYPMPVTSLYSLHMQLIDPSLEVKNSSYKKLAKFLKAMEKRGYLKLKERQGGELVLVSVNSAHPEVSAFVVDQRTAKQIQKNARASDSGASSSAATNTPSAAQDQFIQITDLFKSTASVGRMWKEVGIQKDSLFTRAEVKQAIETYIKVQDLVNKENPRLIKIDAYLADAILSKDEYASVQFLARDAILDRICDKMTPMHSISAPGSDPILRKGAVKPLSILVEKRQGRKTVTRISNMESYLIPPEELATRLKVPCAASTTVAPLQGGGGSSGKPLLHEVLVQGNKVHEVCVVLRDQYGFLFQGGGKAAKLGIKGGSQCRYVEVVDKSL